MKSATATVYDLMLTMKRVNAANDATELTQAGVVLRTASLRLLDVDVELCLNVSNVYRCLWRDE